MVLGCCRAGGAGMPPGSQAFTGGTAVLQPPLLHCKLCTHGRTFMKGSAPDCISKKSLSWSENSFFAAVFSSILLAQWILNREVATANAPGLLEGGISPFHRGQDCMAALRYSVYLYKISLHDHWWNPHCHYACFRNWAHFWRRCHSKASRGMNFNEYIGLPTWDIPSNGIT